MPISGRGARTASSSIHTWPKVGKSSLLYELVACVTNRKPWPDGHVSEPGSVLLLSAEDDPEDTIGPFLEMAGADLDRVETLEGFITKAKGGDGLVHCYFDLVRGVAAFKKKVERMPDLKFVLIDPALAYMGGKDSYKNAEVREALRPYVELAQECRFAFVV